MSLPRPSPAPESLCTCKGESRKFNSKRTKRMKNVGWTRRKNDEDMEMLLRGMEVVFTCPYRGLGKCNETVETCQSKAVNNMDEL